MKITQLFKIYWPDNGGGIAKVMESIADAFPDCRQEIIVCQDDRHKKSSHDCYKGIQVHRCRQMFELASTPVSVDFLRQVKKSTRDSDIVICHFPYPMADLAVLFGMYSGRLVVWWHCGFDKYKKLAPFYRLLVKHTLEKADRILVSSGGNLKHSRLLRAYQKKCTVIPFCVSDECLKRGEAFAARPAAVKKQITILFVGRLVWYKGCEVLLKAFAQMDCPDCRLVLIGSGPLETELKQLAVSLQLGNVTFTGMVSEDEKMRWMEICDFLVLPSVSKAEAFAVVQIEAMAFGKPVINTKLPSGVPYVSLDGVTGRTVKPGSVSELAAAMKELAENEKLRRIYGENARKRVRKKYTQQGMAEKYRKVFGQLLDGRQSGVPEGYRKGGRKQTEQSAGREHRTKCRKGGQAERSAGRGRKGGQAERSAGRGRMDRQTDRSAGGTGYGTAQAFKKDSRSTQRVCCFRQESENCI